MSVPFVKRPLSADELEVLIRNEKDKRVLERLIFIRSLYDGEGVATAAGKLGRSKVTGYEWLKRYNQDGLEKLKPAFGGGRPPKLSKERQEKLKEELKARRDWTTKKINQLVESKFGASYSPRSMRRILRSLKMRYAKPYPRDYQRPADAKTLLQNSLDDALGELEDLEAPDNFIVRFLDECSPQTGC